MNASTLNVILNFVTLILGGTLLGVILRYKLGVRKIAVEAEADIRDHYAEELAALREKLNRQDEHAQRMIEASDRRHEECEQARQIMRRELATLYDEIAGLKRQLIRYSADKVVTLEGSEETLAAASAERVLKIVDDKENGGEVG